MNNICLYTESTEPSGMGRLMLILATELRSYYHFSFVCPPSAEGNRLLKEAAALGLTTYALLRPEDFCGWLSMQSVDVLHNHAGIGWEGHSGVHIAYAEKIPVVRTEHLPYLITDEAQKAEHQHLMGLIERLVCIQDVLVDLNKEERTKLINVLKYLDDFHTKKYKSITQ